MLLACDNNNKKGGDFYVACVCVCLCGVIIKEKKKNLYAKRARAIFF